MSDITETRRKRLDLLALDRGSNWKELAKELGVTPGYLSHIRGRVRTMNEKTARKWEHKLRLPAGWFDTDTAHDGARAPVHVSPELTGEVAVMCKRIVDEELRGKISYAKFYKLVSSAYVHSARVGKVDEEYIRNLVGLMAPD